MPCLFPSDKTLYIVRLVRSITAHIFREYITLVYSLSGGVEPKITFFFSNRLVVSIESPFFCLDRTRWRRMKIGQMMARSIGKRIKARTRLAFVFHREFAFILTLGLYSGVKEREKPGRSFQIPL